MIIATWNVNSLTARWPRVAAWLEEKRPDVLLIQETKMTDAKFPFDDLAAMGYHSAHYGQGQWNGVAIIATEELSDVVRGFGDDDPEARIIGATCGGVRVYSCYVRYRKPNPNAFRIALQWAGLKAQETIFVGDSPEADVNGANTVGMISVLKDPADRHDANSVHANHRLRRLVELRGILAQYNDPASPG